MLTVEQFAADWWIKLKALLINGNLFGCLLQNWILVLYSMNLDRTGFTHLKGQLAQGYGGEQKC